ncbi:MAG: hypothetical protein R3A48_14370 [Polyangiales bacterium]
MNSEALTGTGALPMLAVTPSQRGSIGPGCRVSDVALVQEHRNAPAADRGRGGLSPTPRGAAALRERRVDRAGRRLRRRPEPGCL